MNQTRITASRKNSPLGRFLALFTGLFLLIFHSSPSLSAPITLEGNGGWVDGHGRTSPPTLKGKVVLYDFWDYTCINCIRTFPHLNAIYQKYKNKGLIIVGIHSPEFDFAASPERVARAIAQYHIDFPVVLDKDRRLWDRFKNHYWPSDYLYSPTGTLLYHSIGEGGYDELDNSIVTALHLSSPSSTENSDSTSFSPDLTPELYAGTERGHLGNPSGYHLNDYNYIGHSVINNSIILKGNWSSTPDHVFSGKLIQGTAPSLTVYYQGRGVNAVMRRPRHQVAGTVMVLVDGHPLNMNEAGTDTTITPPSQSVLQVNRSRMYSIVSQQTYGAHRLDLIFETPGTSLYTLTFNP